MLQEQSGLIILVVVQIRWTMGIFGGDAETPDGWTNWASSGEIGFANFVADDSAHSGSYSVLLEENDDNA